MEWRTQNQVSQDGVANSILRGASLDGVPNSILRGICADGVPNSILRGISPDGDGVHWQLHLARFLCARHVHLNHARQVSKWRRELHPERCL